VCSVVPCLHSLRPSRFTQHNCRLIAFWETRQFAICNLQWFIYHFIISHRARFTFKT
jgi:hypothetical protein